MIYITGDTHGEVSRFEAIHKQYGPTANATLIVAGDFDCIFGLGKQDELVGSFFGNHTIFQEQHSIAEPCRCQPMRNVDCHATICNLVIPQVPVL